MSWAMVFLFYTAQGAVHQDILHGYGSKVTASWRLKPSSAGST